MNITLLDLFQDYHTRYCARLDNFTEFAAKKYDIELNADLITKLDAYFKALILQCDFDKAREIGKELSAINFETEGK